MLPNCKAFETDLNFCVFVEHLFIFLGKRECGSIRNVQSRIPIDHRSSKAFVLVKVSRIVVVAQGYIQH